MENKSRAFHSRYAIQRWLVLSGMNDDLENPQIQQKTNNELDSILACDKGYEKDSIIYVPNTE